MKTFTPKRSEEEIREIQNLKNENDWKYNTSQAIQVLGERQIVMSEIQKKTLDKAHSENKALEIQFENLKALVLSEIHEMKEKIGKIDSKVLSLGESFKNLKADTEVWFHEIALMREDFGEEVEKLAELEQETERKDLYLNSSICNLREHFKNLLEEIKVELTPKIPEVDPVKKQIDERFQIFKVDFDGLIKEIAVLKKTSFYDQKKFENVYTLIDRLKEGKK